MKFGSFKSNFSEFSQLVNKNEKYTQLHYVFVIVTQWLGHEFDPQQFWQMSMGVFLFSFFFPAIPYANYFVPNISCRYDI
jgi:hypothetical protein